MKVQEVILRALAGTLTWLQAADILGIHPRSLRRWRARYEAGGTLALYDRRPPRASPGRTPPSSAGPAPGAAIAPAASPAPAWASSCTSTAAPTPGWPSARMSG